MKQIVSLALALVMAAALFTGCACSANVSTEPHGMITSEATTAPSVMPTPTATYETTRPTENNHGTLPTVTGSQPTEDGSMPTDTTGAATSPTGGTAESTTPTDTTTMPRHRNRSTVR